MQVELKMDTAKAKVDELKNTVIRGLANNVSFLFDDGLEPLQNATMLTVEESNGFESTFGCEYHFDIVDQNRNRLYHIAETSERIFNLFSTLPARLQFVILNPKSEAILLISGYDEYCGYPHDFSIDNIKGHCGHILQKRANLCGMTKYSICDRNQEPVFRISTSEFECPCLGVSGNFRIFKKVNRRRKQCGTIKKIRPAKTSNSKTYSVSFESELDTSQKALLMVMAVVLNLRGYKSSKVKRSRLYWRNSSEDSI